MEGEGGGGVLGDAAGREEGVGDAAPMAYERVDVVRGGLWAWLAFMVLLVVATAIATGVDTVGGAPENTLAAGYMFVMVVGFVVPIGGAVSLCITFAGMPLAALLARALRRTRSLAAHLVAFAALGALTGAAVVLVHTAVFAGGSSVSWWAVAISAAATSLSVVFGWWRASRHARRRLRELPPADADPSSPIGLERAFDPDATP